MKSATLIAFFLLCGLFSSLHLSTAQPLLDAEGNIVRNGGTYYLVPAKGSEGNGGGIETAKTGRETCPITVVQSPNEASNGEPLRIESLFRSGFIPGGALVRIGLASPPKCAPSPWFALGGENPDRLGFKLGDYQDTELNYYSFQFQQVSSKLHSYKILYCLREEWYEDFICNSIGIYKDRKGNRRLVVTEDNTLVVVLKKAESSSA